MTDSETTDWLPNCTAVLCDTAGNVAIVIIIISSGSPPVFLECTSLQDGGHPVVVFTLTVIMLVQKRCNGIVDTYI